MINIYKASCWNCDDFTLGNRRFPSIKCFRKRRLHDRKTEHFNALSKVAKVADFSHKEDKGFGKWVAHPTQLFWEYPPGRDHSPAIADHVKTTDNNIKLEHFDILASGRTDYHCEVKETLFIKEL